VDLSVCDREPIHMPSAIQPDGVLIAARLSDLRIAYVSENSSELLGLSPAAVLGQTLTELLGEEQMAAVDAMLKKEQYTSTNILTFSLPSRQGAAFDAIIHQANGLLCIELEPASGETRWDQLSGEMQNIMASLRRQGTLQQLFDASARQVRNLTGYDRVMIYRFNPDGHGQVVAEQAAEGMEPFLGLRYPAGDIPIQARKLYLLQRLRVISTVSYQPVRVLAHPALAGEGASEIPLDMSYCGLRSISPVHLEYLRNMGVGATLTISLIHEHRLWGLVACHHREAKRPSPAVRALADLLGQLISLLLGVIGSAEEYAERLEVQALIDSLGAAFESSGPLADAMVEHGDKLLRCVGADGAFVRLGGQVRLVGDTPSIEDATALMSALQPSLVEGVGWCDEIGAVHPQFAHLTREASGALMVPLMNEPNDGILWFRGEVAQTVRWGGNPHETEKPSIEAGRISPRKSFVAWEEIHRGRSLPWRSSELEAARSLKRVITGALLHRAESELAVLSRYDPLTGLPNRRVLLERITAWQRESAQLPAALLFLDVDNFKTVNDSLGHGVGDQLLTQVSHRIKDCAEECAEDSAGDAHLVARLGGDEFVIFCPHTTVAEAQRLGEAIVMSFAMPFVLDGKPFRTTTSVGIAPVSGPQSTAVTDPLRAADAAMYVSKQRGGNQATVYEDPQHDQLLRQLQLEQGLFQALENSELELHYQPQFSLATRQLIGFEALLRWNHPARGCVMPGEFVPMAERLGLITSIGEWVMRDALRQLKDWRQRFQAGLTMSVNVSVRQVVGDEFPEFVRQCLSQAGVPSSALCIEVTESILMRDQAVVHLDRVRAMGVRISIDDFGTGYSSLAYLQSLPIDEVKLDKSFLRGVGEDARKTALMGAIVHMAHILNLSVIAEGVESSEEWDSLFGIGCDGAQGYFLSRPASREQLERGDILVSPTASSGGGAVGHATA
jgi:diguanylate cyclase (GGDEF)-like protein